MDRTSHSQAVKKTFCGEQYNEVDSFTRSGKLKSGAYLIGRMLSLVSPNLSKKDASKIVAEEVSADWIEKNVYTIETPSIAKKKLIFMRNSTNSGSMKIEISLKVKSGLKRQMISTRK